MRPSEQRFLLPNQGRHIKEKLLTLLQFNGAELVQRTERELAAGCKILEVQLALITVRSQRFVPVKRIGVGLQLMGLF